MGEVINGYKLHKPLSNENAGFAKWGHAEKGGKEFFIKEFLNPCYPMKDSPFDDDAKRAILKTCAVYETEKRLLYSRINEVSDGNVVRIQEFFRWNGKYYITTPWIDSAPGHHGGSAGERLEVEGLYYLAPEVARIRCCMTLSHAVKCLHDAKIVHADIKPRNIMLVRTSAGGISTKIIDMDSSFFVSEPPDELVGDQVYFAPESVMFMIKGPDESPIDCAVDVFALGLVFHQILAGGLPDLPAGYNFACEACLDGEKPTISENVPERIKPIIAEMLDADARNRPSMAEVHRRLWEVVYGRGAGGRPYAKVPHVPVPPSRVKASSGMSFASGGDPAEPKSRLFISPGLNGGDSSSKVPMVSAESETEMVKAFYRPDVDRKED